MKKNYIIDLVKKINSEDKRKKFLIYFFTLSALLSLLIFGIKGFLEGRIAYTIILAVFFILALANLIIQKFFDTIKLSGHIMLLLMFLLELELFCSIGTGTSGLFWYYVFPPLAIAILGNKKGTIYSLILLVVMLIIYVLKPHFLTNTYPKEIIFRFILSYSVVIFLIYVFEYARYAATKAYLKNLEDLKLKNEELSAAEEELRQANEELLVVNENIKAQKETIEKQNEKLNKYFTAIEQSAATIVFTDLKGNIEYANPQFEKMTGYTIEEVRDKNVNILKSEKTPENTYKKLWDTILSGKTWQGEYINRKKDGTEFYVKAIISPIKNDKGEISNFVAIKEDITELKKAEEALKLKNEELTVAEEELRQTNEELLFVNEDLKAQKETIEKQNEQLNKYFTAIEQSAATIVFTDLKGSIEYANPQFEKMTGYTIEEALGKNPRILNSGKTPKSTIKELWDTILSGKTWQGEFINRKKEGTEFYEKAIISPIKNDKVEISNFVAIKEDITELKKAEREIEEKAKQQEILINNIPAGIFYKNKNLQYILINNNYSKILNVPIKEAIGKKYSELFNTPEGIEFENLDRKIIETKEPVYNIEDQHINEDGSVHWFYLSKVPYFDKNNNVIGIIGIVQDITERKKQEQLIIEQKEQISYAYKNITESINYAKHIQNALMPTEKLENELLKEHFLLFKPKENVSGDFYYIYKNRDTLIFAVADCTGHGVSGGFMTMLSISFLNNIVKRDQVIKPSEILEGLRKRIKEIFKQHGTDNQNGLDIALCSVDTKTNIMQYAGAYNPLWIIRNNELIEYKATRNPIGFYPLEKEFKNNEIQLQDKDLIYLFSDGYIDQIGDPNNEKFSKRLFRKKLLEIHNLSLSEQKTTLLETLQQWMGEEEQTDDITVMGIKWTIK